MTRNDKEHIVNLRLIMIALTLSLVLAASAHAAPETPVATKGVNTYTLEDLCIYWLRNLGKDGLLDFFQTMVVYEEGKRQGLAPSQQEVDSFINDTMGRDIYDEFRQLYSDRAVRQLVEYTLVTSDYEQWLRDKIRRDKNITVTESEAHEFFLSNIDLFHTPEGVWISLISLPSQAQADEVLRRLGTGENFNDIAGEVNMDSQMRAARGELGIYHRGEGLPEALEEAAFTLRENQYSGIIKGTNYHIVMCHKRYSESSPSFDEVKEDLMLELVEAKIDPYYVDELNALMANEMPNFNITADLFKPDE
jgi:parvulin-like peptidyl-prolyl isomerase